MCLCQNLIVEVSTIALCQNSVSEVSTAPLCQNPAGEVSATGLCRNYVFLPLHNRSLKPILREKQADSNPFVFLSNCVREGFVTAFAICHKFWLLAFWHLYCQNLYVNCKVES